MPFTVYENLCQIDLYLNNIISEYPFNIREQARFTLHEVNVKYKANYCNQPKNETNIRDTQNT